MCGIVGYVGNNNSLDILIDGLKHLEYRGYDSAGIAYVKDNNIKITKEVGKISSLESILDKDESYIGIGHTRWATHGKPTKNNAHPHNVGKITLVHNGIIENYNELKTELINNGYNFVGETDTEVACAYIDYVYKSEKDMLKTIVKVSKIFKGSYAFGIICSDELDKIYAIRNDSPLIIGISDDGYFIASDVPAILKYTNKYIDLNNLEIAVLGKDIFIYNNKLVELKKDISIFDGDISNIEKNGYETYMLKEINEQPDVINKTIADIFDNNIFDGIPNLNNYNQIDIVACGSAYHAGLIGKYFIEKYVGIRVNVELASEYQYKNNLYCDKSLVIAISQSGETADTKKCIEKVNNLGIDTLAIVNVVGSSIARISKYVIYTKAGSEIAVATTKAYLSQITVLSMMAYKFSDKEFDIKKDLDMITKYINELLNKDYISIAKEIYENDDIYFIGRGYDYYTCLEGSLKLKEISYIHSEAYAAGELKHGTISLIEEETPVFVVATSDELVLKTISNAKEVKARGAKVFVIINDEKYISDDFDEYIVIPKVNELLTPILSIIPLQLISYNVAKLRNCDIDKPKNLAKSVTVE